MTRNEGTDKTNRRKNRLIVLTLKKHLDGIWITKLVERLEESVPPIFDSIQIEVKTLEDWLAGGWLVSDDNGQDDNDTERVLGLINRVSDAAPPGLFKACCALLAVLEESRKIPVWNGSTAYSLCGNKWRHHILFHQARLMTPTTISYFCGEKRTIEIDLKIFRQNPVTGITDILLKPNAGGFGAGIQKLSVAPQESLATKTKVVVPPSFEDGMALIQQYEQPKDGKLYRVWFLNGKVQCAMERTIQAEVFGNNQVKSSLSSFSSEFTSGCAGGNVCTFSGSGREIREQNNLNDDSTEIASSSSKKPQPLASSAFPTSIYPWEIPEEVEREIEEKLLPLLTDAHCGSVEFLYTSSTQIENSSAKSANSHFDSTRDNKEEDEIKSKADTFASRRLYFDLNLMSTLPVIDNLTDYSMTANENSDGLREAVWKNGYDPWLELASAIWDFCMSKNENEQIRIQ